MDYNQIQEIIRMVGKHKIAEFVLKEGDFKLVVRAQTHAEGSVTPVMLPMQQPLVAMPQAVAPAPPVAAAPAESAPVAEKAPAPASAPAPANASNLIPLKSPMVGTFYRSASPEKPPFLKIGDMVDLGQTVCIIEAMKLFNEIESDVKGRVVKILVEDRTPVEYDQPLFMLEPA